ncbi:helix-turn-helix transcriptional regulator [Actinomyces slackii]|uniref:DNA-binding transcriptional regulator AraC n=1 Tax=Actinomyces slackii TaxID=52774 RepID=A0A3S4SJZ6_9ACTO|nr:helix-turn-helix transcriptional regulator [Actinomyces slackii]VEG74483.1 DNA-binding transcriptional regulator AraC [Actinomyces slackii]
MGRPEPWSGGLDLLPGAVVYRGPGGVAHWHQHLAIQVIVASGGPCEVETSDGLTEVPVGETLMVPSGQRHRLSCQGELTLLLVEPYGPRGRRVGGLPTAPADVPVSGTPADVVEAIIGRAKPVDLSPAVDAALRHLDEHASGPDASLASLSRAARAAHLSPSRLTHRFTAEVGIPFRRYALWVRLRTAVEAIARGAGLADAAAHSGFSDGAHLSRVFRRNVGLPPSQLLRMTTSVDNWP